MNRRNFLNILAASGLCRISPLYSLGSSLKTPFPELNLSGKGEAVGLVHGRTFADQIKYNLAFYIDLLSFGNPSEKSRLLQLAGGFGTVISRHLPEQLQEMKGIAKGAGLTLEEILLLNARTEMFVKVSQHSEPVFNPGCTALAIINRDARKPLLALGQNWDWNPVLADAPVLLRQKPAKGPSLVTLTEAGMVGKIGFNRHGLGVCLNFLSHTSDYSEYGFGIPVHCLLRAIMGCATLEEACALVNSMPRSASANFLVAQQDKGAPVTVSLECTPNTVKKIKETRGFLTHTNHFKSPSLMPGCTSGLGFCTVNRDKVAQKMSRLLAGKISDPVARMKKVLKSRQGAPYSISKSFISNASIATLAGIIMDLSRNRLHLTSGPPHVSAWMELKGA
jgi:isopenicillin-N N-acyltransferase-like protein